MKGWRCVSATLRCGGKPGTCGQEDTRMRQLHARGDASTYPVVNSLHSSGRLVVAEHFCNAGWAAEFSNQFCVFAVCFKWCAHSGN